MYLFIILLDYLEYCNECYNIDIFIWKALPVQG